jgi:hypothetical protein
MVNSFPASLSMYRGQSRQGIGEGPGRPILQGEQYLYATSPELAEVELLDAVRPWMSLDSDPADHRRLHDRLEAWSYLHHGQMQLVVRLVSAGLYDDRAAYFAHGRAWPAAARAGFDPGLHLGRSEVFEHPFRNGEKGARVLEPPPVLVRPDQVAAEPQVAASVLAHLFQCCIQNRPLILAAPISEFASGSAFHALLSFAHGALPADLKPGCRVRVYTQTPELFLRHLDARLVAVTEEVATSALRASPEATLLDRQGRLLAGEPPDPQVVAYAEAVLERAIQIPDGLALFSERYRDRLSRPGLPAAGDILAIQVTYNLAVALAGSAAERGDLLQNYLLQAAGQLGPELGWDRLLTSEEWREFPLESLADLLLLVPEVLPPGVRALQMAVEKAAGRLGITVDSRLATWWEPGMPAKLRRLLALADRETPLVSSAAFGERTADLPIRSVAAIRPVEGLLASGNGTPSGSAPARAPISGCSRPSARSGRSCAKPWSGGSSIRPGRGPTLPTPKAPISSRRRHDSWRRRDSSPEEAPGGRSRSGSWTPYVTLIPRPFSSRTWCSGRAKRSIP